MICLKFCKINLNNISETPVLKILFYILFEQIHNVVVDILIFCYLKIKAIRKEIFVVSFELCGNAFLIFEKLAIKNYRK